MIHPAPGQLKSFLVISYESVMTLLFSLPRYRTLNALKGIFLKLNGARIGKRVVFYPGVWIAPGYNLEIGDDVDLALNVVIEAAGGVTIGARTLIGHGTKIISGNHGIPASGRRITEAKSVRRPVFIGQDAWIGANCIILPGRNIGEGAVVGAGSVVTKDVAPFTIVAGNPARYIRKRD